MGHSRPTPQHAHRTPTHENARLRGQQSTAPRLEELSPQIPQDDKEHPTRAGPHASTAPSTGSSSVPVGWDEYRAIEGPRQVQAPPLTSAVCKCPRGLRLTQTRPGPSASRHTKALQRGSSWPGCGVGCGPSVLVLFPTDRRDLGPQSCRVAARFPATVPLRCAGGGHSCALTYLSLPRAKPETARGRVEGLLAQRGCDHPRGPWTR